MKSKIKYKDLSGWLKFIVVYGFVSAAVTSISFVVGFFIGLASY